MAFLAGLHHWWPKLTGRVFSETWGRVGTALFFLGINLAFFPQLVLGLQGMPQRLHSYDLVSPGQLPLLKALHLLSTIGAATLIAAIAVAGLCLAHSLLRSRRAERNPWGAATLEWQADSPPAQHNFDPLPHCTAGPYDFQGATR